MRVIDADALLELYANAGTLNIDAYKVPVPIVRQNIIDAPTLDYAPVKHARWEKDKDDMFWGNSFIHMRCSLCGSEAHLNRFGMAYVLSQFCPNCGALMDGKEGT